MSAPIRVILNGAPREFPAPVTFSQLLAELDLAGKRTAVERNGEIVKRVVGPLGIGIDQTKVLPSSFAGK